MVSIGSHLVCPLSGCPVRGERKSAGVYADVDEASVSVPISALPESWAGVLPYVSTPSG